MRTEEQLALWYAEEQAAHIHGWDFSHIAGRYTEEDDLPWDYRTLIEQYREPNMTLLDMDTGGGEFLLSLNHPYQNTAATEGYPPNIDLCRRTLSPLGINFHPANADESLPFEDGCFDLVLNRHGSFNPQEIYRILKPGGRFITQQVGAENDRELVELLLPEITDLAFPEQYLSITADKFRAAGFEILNCDECFRSIRFFDVGALVWFARIIEWEFPGFSVDACLEQLKLAQKLLLEQGFVEGRTHRFFLVARKPL